MLLMLARRPVQLLPLPPPRLAFRPPGVSQTPLCAGLSAGIPLARRGLPCGARVLITGTVSKTKQVSRLMAIRGSKGNDGIWEWRGEGCHFKGMVGTASLRR